LEILYVLLVLLVATRVLGELAVRIGQPALTGELFAGVLIGILVTHQADTFPVLSGLADNHVFRALTDLGIFFLMLMAGLELRPEDLVKTSTSSVMVALGGLLLPFALGWVLALWFLPDSALRTAQSLFIGVALAITAVPVSVGVLLSLGKLDTPVGRVIVSAAVVDDVLSLLLLAVLTAILQTGGVPEASDLLLLSGKIGSFFIAAIALGLWAFPKLGNQVVRFQSAELEFSFVVIVGLAYAVLAELLSMHFLIGAFVAGLFFRQSTIDEAAYDDVSQKLSAVTQGFLAPVFFASIGMHLSGAALVRAPLFVLSLLVTATVGKLLGAGLPARLSGMSNRDSLAVAVGMNARGAVELVIADVAFRAGLFEVPDPPPPVVASMYSAIVLTAIATTFATPIALKWIYRKDPEPA
jgi:Kef-type K+ transport system membrane component KefB